MGLEDQEALVQNGGIHYRQTDIPGKTNIYLTLENPWLRNQNE